MAGEELYFNVPEFFWGVFNLVFGGKGQPWYEIVFLYALPALLVFFTLEDLFYLMGFFRKITATVMAAVFALMFSHFGFYKDYNDFVNALFFTPFLGEMGGLMSMFTTVFTFGIVYWFMSNFFIGFVNARAASKGLAELSGGGQILTAIGKKAGQLGMNEGSNKQEKVLLQKTQRSEGWAPTFSKFK